MYLAHPKDVQRMLSLVSTYNLETSDRIEDQFCLRAQRLKQFIQDGSHFPSELIQCIASLTTKGFTDPELFVWALYKRQIFLF